MHQRSPKKKILLIGLAWLAAVTPVFPVSELSSERIFLQDIARITFTFDDKPASYKAVHVPAVAGLHINGPELSSSFYTQIQNGNMTTKSVHKLVFTISAEKEGRYTIPPITIKVDGQVYNGRQHQLEVLPAQKQDPFFQDFFGRLRRPSPRKQSIAKAKMFVTNPNPFVGELFGAYYSVGTNIDRPRVSFSPTHGQPDLTGFYSRLINAERMPPGPPIPGLKNPPLEGAAYNLIALKPGRLTLGGHTISVVDMERIFRDSSKVQVAPLEVNVRPLPEAGRPAGFGGTVGTFSVELITDAWPVQIDQWQEISVDLLIEGEGNLHLLDSPDPELSGLTFLGAEKIRSELPELPGSPTGFVQIRYNFAADSAGTVRPGQISFHWFDPQLGQYQTSNHPLPKINVVARPAQTLNLTLPQVGGGNYWLVAAIALAAAFIAGAGIVRRFFQPDGRAAEFMEKWSENRPAVRRDAAAQILARLCGRKSGHLLERYLRDSGFSRDEIVQLSALQRQRLLSEQGVKHFNPGRQEIEILKSIAAGR